MTSLKKNFIYNIGYQILSMILPVITVPYVSRILGVEGVGIYSYTYSITYYFMLIGMLGINNYGNRTIAKVREDKQQLSKNFLGIFIIQLVANCVMIVGYVIYILFFDVKYKVIAIIQIIYLISNALDINWFFFGLEKFKITVVKNTILKIISIILIFMFVKKEDDLWIYTLILSTSTMISQMVLFPALKREIKYERICIEDITKHIKNCFILFIPVIAVSIYKVMDKIMIGWMTNVEEVGYYEQAEKIVNMPLGVVTALGTVMLPRISNLVDKKDEKKVKEYISKSVNIMMFLAFPICFGLIAISSDFIPMFLGENFSKSSVLIYYLSLTIIFISFANIIRTQYLIPKEKDKIYITSVILGGIVNLCINFLLIPKYKSIGACIGTVIAEFIVMLYQIILVRKELPIKEYIKNAFVYMFKGIIMLLIVLTIKILKINTIIKIVIQVVVGILIYFLLNVKYIKEIFINKIRKKEIV